MHETASCHVLYVHMLASDIVYICCHLGILPSWRARLASNCHSLGFRVFLAYAAKERENEGRGESVCASLPRCMHVAAVDRMDVAAADRMNVPAPDRKLE